MGFSYLNGVLTRQAAGEQAPIQGTEALGQSANISNAFEAMAYAERVAEQKQIDAAVVEVSPGQFAVVWVKELSENQALRQLLAQSKRLLNETGITGLTQKVWAVAAGKSDHVTWPFMKDKA